VQSLIEFDGISVAILFGFIQSLIIIYLFGIKKRFLQHRPLIWLMIVIMISLIESFFLRSGLMSKYPHFMNIANPFIFLLGPFAYEYVLSQLGIVTRFRFKLLNLLPFLFYFAYSFNFFLQSPHFKYNLYVQTFRPDVETTVALINFPTDPWNIQGWVVVEILSFHLIIYALLSLLKIKKHYRQNPNTNKDKIYWLYYITGIFIAGALVLFFSQGGIINGKVFFKSPFPNYYPDLFSTASMYLITIYILGKPNFFKLNGKKYSKSTLSSEFKKEKLNQVILILEKDQLFLKPNFSLKMLSDKSGISKHHISQILNEELQLNFFELTNKYRIQEGKKRLINTDDYIKMEQLAYELGYKSKSTFFAAFKKVTNLTPQKYRDLKGN